MMGGKSDNISVRRTRVRAPVPLRRVICLPRQRDERDGKGDNGKGQRDGILHRDGATAQRRRDEEIDEIAEPGVRTIFKVHRALETRRVEQTVNGILVDSPVMRERLGGDSSPRLLCAPTLGSQPGALAGRHALEGYGNKWNACSGRSRCSEAKCQQMSVGVSFQKGSRVARAAIVNEFFSENCCAMGSLANRARP